MIDLDEAGVSVPRQVVKFKTFNEDRLASFFPGGRETGTGEQTSPDRSAAVRRELNLRRELWETLLAEGGPQGVAPSRLRELGIYGGAQGCWVDKQRTRHLTDDGTGATVGVLHTGRDYADDLSENEILYHYPRTGRQPARDRSEIEATKAASRLGLPVFVISQPRRGLRTRDVHLGWIEDWDDDAELFLISFGDSPAALPEPETTEETPFNLVEDSTSKKTTADSRPGQRRFKFRVLQRYGARYAICDIDYSPVLDGAHLRPKRLKGTDDARNGLVLCALHHRALDGKLYAIDPDSLQIRIAADGPSLADLRIRRESINHLPNKPHWDALEWLWNRRGKAISSVE